MVFPSSHCPNCNAPIAWYDNLPVVSYILLGGKCRRCKERISPRYPLVELLTAVLFLICYVRSYSLPQFIINLVFVSLVVPLIFIDFYHYILPNVITLSGMVIGLALSPFQPASYWSDFATVGLFNALGVKMHVYLLQSIMGSLLGIVLGGGTLWLVGTTYYLIRKVEGLGFGDIKMMAMVGAFLGWKLAWLTIFIASAAGSLFGLYLMAARGKDLRHALYFGTFLGIGAIVSLFYGEQFLNWYFRRM